MRRLLVQILVCATAAVACTSTADSPAPEWQLADAVAATTERLAAAGIAVYGDAEDRTPVIEPVKPASPMRLLSWQVRSMVLEAHHGAGLTATALDEVAPPAVIGGVTRTASAIIAGWALHGETEAAEYARELLGDRAGDPGAAVFPELVTVLFTADLATAGAAIARAAKQPGRSAKPALWLGVAADATSAGPCSAVVRFVDHTIATVFNAIGHLAQPAPLTGGGVFAPLVKVVNAIAKAFVGAVNVAIDGAFVVVQKLGRVAINALLAPVARIAGIVGTVAQVASAVRPWTLALTADPTRNRKAISPEAPLTGTLTARIDLGGLDEWPPFLADCARQAGKPLPPLKPEGNQVTWTLTGTQPDLIVGDGTRSVLDADGVVTTTYETTVEPKFEDSSVATGLVHVTATVQRDDLTKLQRSFEEMIQDGLRTLSPPVGGVISTLVFPFVQPLITRAFAKLAHLRDIRATLVGGLPIDYHVENRKAPAPEPPLPLPSSPGTGGAPITPTKGETRLPASCPAALGGYPLHETNRQEWIGRMSCSYPDPDDPWHRVGYHVTYSDDRPAVCRPLVDAEPPPRPCPHIPQ